MTTEPIDLFHTWHAEAHAAEDLADAVCLATSTPDGFPSARMVLLKAADPNGFVFYTNLGSQKARELTDNPNAALCFHWKSLKRQVRVMGAVTPVSDATADAYFASRARISQIGAWASRQSEALDDRFALEKAVVKYTAKFGTRPVPRPEHWSGFRLAHIRIEFWEELPFRLHRRRNYTQTPDGWREQLLFP